MLRLLEFQRHQSVVCLNLWCNFAILRLKNKCQGF